VLCLCCCCSLPLQKRRECVALLLSMKRSKNFFFCHSFPLSSALLRLWNFTRIEKERETLLPSPSLESHFCHELFSSRPSPPSTTVASHPSTTHFLSTPLRSVRRREKYIFHLSISAAFCSSFFLHFIFMLNSRFLARSFFSFSLLFLLLLLLRLLCALCTTCRRGGCVYTTLSLLSIPCCC
jgi:hypothetical protein